MGQSIITRRGALFEGLQDVGIATVKLPTYSTVTIVLTPSRFSGVPILPGDELLGTVSYGSGKHSSLLHGHCMAEGESAEVQGATVGNVIVQAYSNVGDTGTYAVFHVYRKT